MAEGGTFFLDEVTELSFGAQAMLLRVLQERTVRRVGETDEIPMDVRVITASNRNLPELMEKKLFRNDLYYRLNTLHIDLPPLRERGNDVLALARFFLCRFSGLAPEEVAFSQEVAAALSQHPWPGNVRELRNIVEYAVHMGAKGAVESCHLPAHLFPGPTAFENISPPDASSAQISFKGNSLAEIIGTVEREALVTKLRECGTSLKAKKRIARLLGISLTTLYAKLSKYGL